MNIPEGTVLARASRDKWTPRIQAAKSLAKPVSARSSRPVSSRADDAGTRRRTQSAWQASLTRLAASRNAAARRDSRARAKLEQFDFRAQFGLDLSRRPAVRSISICWRTKARSRSSRLNRLADRFYRVVRFEWASTVPGYDVATPLRGLRRRGGSSITPRTFRRTDGACSASLGNHLLVHCHSNLILLL